MLHICLIVFMVSYPGYKVYRKRQFFRIFFMAIIYELRNLV
jgi:hypothetical protein